MPIGDVSFGQVVAYNGGEGKANRLAFVTGAEVVNEGTLEEGLLCNLLVFDGDGNGTIHDNVARRAPADYDKADPPGGGSTWYYADF